MELIYPGLGLIFWMTLSFLLLFFILKKFAWKPILSMLQQREQKIDEALHAAEKAREEMKELQINNEKLLRDAKVEREKIVAEARQLKDKILDEARQKGNEEAQRMVEAAREAIKFEKMAAITELKNQIALLSIDIAEKVLNEELAVSAKQKQLINNLLDEINFN
jgi:F-type H+-transporting ATPase subunit b